MDKKLKIIIITAIVIVISLCIADRICIAKTGMNLADNAKAFVAEKIEEGIDKGMDMLIYGEVQPDEPEHQNSAYNGF